MHGTPTFEMDHGRWRTRARAIWQRVAPWVTILPAFEMLVPHGSAKVDEVHWCIDTTQYEEYLSSVLTAIVARVERGIAIGVVDRGGSDVSGHVSG